MAAQSGKTSSKSDTVTAKTSTTSSAPTGRPAEPSAATTQRTATPAPARPAPSARSGIRIHVNTVLTVVDNGGSSRSVKAIQYALADRGFDPGTRSGRFDQGTRNAYRKYQASINESTDGVPTSASLNFLGFDII